MSNDQHTNNSLDEHGEHLQDALLHILKVISRLPGRMLLYGSLIGSTALMLSTGEPAAEAFVTGVGVTAFADLLKSIAGGDHIPEEKIQAEVRQAIEETNVMEEVKLQTDMLVRLLKRTQLLEVAERKREHEMLRLLIGQLSDIEELQAYLNSVLPNIHQSLETLADRQQRALPALSAKPITDRRLHDLELVGRASEITWLREHTGDMLVVGQPGSGKTFLLYLLALEGRGLFVNTQDIDETARAFRELRPDAIFIDNAQIDLNFLRKLIYLRSEEFSSFKIVATCWPSYKEEVSRILGFQGSSDVLLLKPLTREEIVQVIILAGLSRPLNLIHEIVSQAGGLPGIARMLVEILRHGELELIASGKAMKDEILSFVPPDRRQRIVDVLAAFSLGGNLGMSIEKVSRGLKVPHLDVCEITAEVGTGGIIHETEQGNLIIRPIPLRHALVRDTFLTGAFSHPLEPILQCVPSLQEAVKTIIQTIGRGGTFPKDHADQLIRLVEEADSDTVWNEYAWLGRSECTYILHDHPKKLKAIAAPALDNAPEVAIPLLMESAVSDQLPSNNKPELPRLISEWLNHHYHEVRDTMAKRGVAFVAVKIWLTGGKDVGVGLQVLEAILNPEWENLSSDPGNDLTVVPHHGYLTIRDLQALRNLWPQVRDLIAQVHVIDWKPLCRAVHAWAHAPKPRLELDSDRLNLIRTCALEMLKDLISWVANRPGFLHWVGAMANHLGLPIEVPDDKDFKTLFPSNETHLQEGQIATQNLRLSAVRELAMAWCNLDPATVVSRINYYENEASAADITWPRYTPMLCTEIANCVQEPQEWIKAAIGVNMAGDLARPFLVKVTQREQVVWAPLIRECFGKPALEWVAVYICLTTVSCPEDLFVTALKSLRKYPELVSQICAQGTIPEQTMLHLLRHNEDAIAGAAALGEWNMSQGTVRESLRETWKDAVLHHLQDGYWLGKILRTDLDLAWGWLQIQVKKPYSSSLTTVFHHGHADLDYILTAIGEAHRHELISLLPESSDVRDFVALLVGNDLGLFHVLLADKRLWWLHLSPLTGDTTGTWAEMAQLALDAGYGPEEIAAATLGPCEYEGNESDLWSGWIEKFERVRVHGDPRIRQIGLMGKRMAERRCNDALARERDKAIYGLDR